MPKILWDGDANGTMLKIVSVAESEIRGLWIDGNDCNGVTGVHVYCEPTFPGQRLTFRQCMIENNPLYGVRLTADADATCDYFAFDMVDVSDNGINLRIEGDIRQVDYRGGSLLTAGTYAVDVNSGWFNGTDCLFGRSGTADILLGSNTAGVSLHTSKHESNEVLVTADDAASYSPGTPPISLIDVCQDLYTTPWSGEVAIDYNAYKGLILVGCKFVGDVNIGTSALGVVSINTEFIPLAYSGVTGSFTGATEKVTQLGVGVVGVANFHSPILDVAYSPPWPNGLSLTEADGTDRHLISFHDGEPNVGDANTYYRVGDRAYNIEPYVGRPAGWACIQTGSLDGDTAALWTPMAPVGWLWGSATWDPASLNNGSGETSSAITVEGAALGDAVLVCPPCSLASLLCTGWVDDANEVKIRVYNATGGAVDIAGGEWKVRVVKPPSE